jgi:metal-sulfur cluster biosynthetic enzyme
MTHHHTRDELVETLRTVACCDQRVGVGELGLVDEVTVTEEGVAHVQVLPCCTYGMARLEHEVEREAHTVEGVVDVTVDVAWDDAWDPSRMAEAVEDATPDIEELAEEHGLEPRWLDFESDSRQ